MSNVFLPFVETRPVKYVVSFSGGLTSFEAARRVIAVHGLENVELRFADTKTEEPDLYRFVGEIEKEFGWTVKHYADGRNVWEVFNDNNMMGNTAVDHCSRILKRELLSAELRKDFSPDEAICVIGMDWEEGDRIETCRQALLPYKAVFPLADTTYGPLTSKCEIAAFLRTHGIVEPQLYRDGFPHGNCGGFCIKAGLAQFQHLLKVRPETYAYHEKQEAAFRARVGKDVSILRLRRKGEPSVLTMTQLRERIQAGEDFSREGWGGCGCFVGGNNE